VTGLWPWAPPPVKAVTVLEGLAGAGGFFYHPAGRGCAIIRGCA
jgi:hypothetical protein